MKKKLEPILELELSPLVGPSLKFEPDLGPLVGIEFGPNKTVTESKPNLEPEPSFTDRSDYGSSMVPTQNRPVYIPSPNVLRSFKCADLGLPISLMSRLGSEL